MEDDKELAAARVLAGVGHRESADLVRPRIAGCLALDFIAGAARTDAGIAGGQITRVRVAALNHEVGNDAMKLHTIVEPTVGELLEVLDGLWGILVIQIRDHGAAIGFEGSVFHD